MKSLMIAMKTGEVPRERRYTRRFNLAVPVLFRCASPGDDQNWFSGFTRDLSASGMYIVSDELQPATEAALSVVVLLPSRDPKKVGLKLKAEATVIRSGAHNEEAGFAVASDFSNDEIRLSV